MKKYLLPIIGLMLIAGISACDTPIESSPTPTTSTTTEPTTIDMNKKMTYSVTVLAPDGTPFNDTNTMAQWCDGDLCFIPVKLDANGYASTELMPKTYGLHLLNLPEQYAYDSEGYNPTFENPSVTIQLYNVNSYEEVEENGPYSTYKLLEEGVYRVNIKSAKHMPYFTFLPSRPGVFVVESYTANLGPIFIDYGSNPHYVENYVAQVNTGGNGKNFRYEYPVSSSQILTDENGKYIPNSGVSCIFALVLKGQASYPVSFDICIRWDRALQEAVTTTTLVKPEETLTQYEVPSAKQLIKCDLNGTVVAVYNEQDKFYHLGSESGPVITAKLTKTILEFEFPDPISEFTASAGNGALTFVVDESDFEITRKDYTDFIAAYAKVCNSDGVYPVTKELKEFLHILASNGGYFRDGGYIAELIDFQVQPSNYWLFACYYYYDIQSDMPIYGDGSETKPFIVTTGSYYAYFEPNKDVYYTFAGNAGKYTIASDFANIKLIVDGQEYTSSSGLPFEFELKERGSLAFTISTTDNLKANVPFTITANN